MPLVVWFLHQTKGEVHALKLLLEVWAGWLGSTLFSGPRGCPPSIFHQIKWGSGVFQLPGEPFPLGGLILCMQQCIQAVRRVGVYGVACALSEATQPCTPSSIIKRTGSDPCLHAATSTHVLRLMSCSHAAEAIMTVPAVFLVVCGAA